MPFEPADEEVDLLVELTAGASPALLRALMEGVKRTLIVGPKTGRPTDNPVAVFGSVIAAVAPAPEYTPPPLWADANAVGELAVLAWPMPRRNPA
jgi:hypothetical protein